MTQLNVELTLWREKLNEWGGQFDSDSPIKAEAAATLAKSLTDADAPTVLELTRLFANAFNIDEEEASRLLVYIPEPQTSEYRATAPTTLPVTGIMKEYVEWLAEQESPAQYHVFTLLALFGAALGRRTHVKAGPFVIFPNIYAVLVGPTGARKNGAISIAKQIVTAAAPTLHVLPKEGSPQGLVIALSRQQQVTGSASGLLSAEEFRVLVGSRKESYKTEIPVWLTDWWDCPDKWDRALAEFSVELENVCISLVAGTTMSWFREMPVALLKGGFIPRTLLIPAGDKKHWKLEPYIDKSQGQYFVQKLKEALTDIPETCHLSPDALKLLTHWYEEVLPGHVVGVSTGRQDFLQRAHIHVYKLAMCINLLESRGAEITYESMEAAINLIRWVDGTLDIMLSLLETEERQLIYIDIQEYLNKKSGRPTLEKEIVRALRNKYKSKEVKEALQSLVLSGDVAVGRVGVNKCYTSNSLGATASAR